MRRTGTTGIGAGDSASRRDRAALVTGATGFIGRRLAVSLAQRGWKVRCLVRDRRRAAALAQAGMELHEGDVLDADSLRGAGEGVEVAYYLVHAMGRGGEGDFEERERRAQLRRVGLTRGDRPGRLPERAWDRPQSKHLRSRHRTAEILAEHGPPLAADSPA